MYSGDKYEIELMSDGTWRKKENNNGGCGGAILLFIIICAFIGNTHKSPKTQPKTPIKETYKQVQVVPDKQVSDISTKNTLHQSSNNTKVMNQNRVKQNTDLFNNEKRQIERQHEKELKLEQRTFKQIEKENKRVEKQRLKDEKRLLKQAKKEAKKQKQNSSSVIQDAINSEIQVNKTE